MEAEPSIEQCAHEFIDRMEGFGTTVTRENLTAHLVAKGCRLTTDFLWNLKLHHNEGLCPPAVSEFFALLLQGIDVTSVLNPWMSEGTLLKPIVDRFAPERVVGFSKSGSSIADALLPKSCKIISGSWDDAVMDSEDLFDVIVSVLPFGLKITLRGQSSDKSRDAATVLIMRSCRRLKRGGIGVFVVSPGFLIHRQNVSISGILEELDLHIEAAFLLPAGTFKPSTGIESYIIIIRHGAPKAVFVAEAAPPYYQAVINNYHGKFEGDRPELGGFVDLQNFTGMEALVSAHRFGEDVKRSARTTVPLSAISKFLEEREPGVLDDNAIYIQRAGSFEVRGPSEPPEDFKGWLEISIDPKQAIAEVVAKYLMSPVGRLAVRSCVDHQTVKRFDPRRLGDIPILLPTMEDQEKLFESDRKMADLLSTVDELRTSLWHPSAVLDEVIGAFNVVNQVDTFPLWLDTLPFPLASILWNYHAVRSDDLRAYLLLSHFFEALAQFLATILLSARKHLEPDSIQKVIRVALKQSHNLKTPSFATWTTIFAYLAKRVRTDIVYEHGEGLQDWKQATACDDANLLQALVSKDMVKLLDDAGKRRNRWQGHGNVIADVEARHRRYQDLLASFRVIVGSKWASHTLVLPNTFRQQSGHIVADLQKLMGPRTPFETIKLSVERPMDEGRLHFVSEKTGKVCELLPFLHMGPAPAQTLDTCYFFNHFSKDGANFVVFQSPNKEELIINNGRMSELIEAIYD